MKAQKSNSLQEIHFQTEIFNFQFENNYKKPWQVSSEPYNVWLFEIIMQQTRMQQGIPYYNQIIQKFPTLESLALANEEDLFKLWKGLGYYSRARNLHFTAKYIYYDLKGKFPNTYFELLKLKGVGEYTAAAIASFCFNENVAVLDGNVFRILSRYFGMEDSMDTSIGKKKYQTIANNLLIKGKSAEFNQSIMDVGSQICTPQNPQCSRCLFQTKCIAFSQNKIMEFPPKKNRPILKNRFFYNVFLEMNGKIFLKRRTKNDIWKGLYEGFMIESEEFDIELLNTFLNTKIKLLNFGNWEIQKLSHQKIHMKIAYLSITKIEMQSEEWIQIESIKEVPFPRILSKWWEHH